MRAEFLTLEISANTSAEDELKKLKKELDDVDREQDQFARGQKKTREEVRRTKEELEEEAERLRVLRRRLNAAATSSTRASSKFGGVASSLLRGAASAGKFGIAAAGVAEGFRLIGSAAELSSRAVEAQVKLLKDAALTAAEFEQEVTRVSAIAGGGAADFARLRQAASEGGQATLFSAQQSAEALRFLAQAGLDARQSAAALPGTLQLAGAGMLSLSDAADIATNVLSGYKLEVSELGNVNDILVSAATSSNTNVTELGRAFSFTAGIASATSQEIENITALFGSLANAGIKSTRAGRSVAFAIQRIAKPTAEGRQVLERYNVALQDADGTTRELTEVLEELERKGASSADIIGIFGAVAGRSLITVLNQGTDKLETFANQFENASGTAARFQETLQDTASAQLRIFNSTLETLSIEVGSRFNPALKEGAGILAENTAELATNSEFLAQFETIAVDAVAAAREILLVTAELTPALTLLGGVTLEVAKNARLLALGFKLAGRATLATTGNFQLAAQGLTDDLGKAYELVGEASGDFGDSIIASAKIGEELRNTLRESAREFGSLETNMRLGVDSAYDVRDAFEDFGDALKALGLADTRTGLEKIGDFFTGVGRDVGIAKDAVEDFYDLLKNPVAPPPVFAIPDVEAPEGSTAERERQLEVARIQLRIAQSTDEVERARLAAAIKLSDIKARQKDDELLSLERQLVFKELENEIAKIRSKRRPRGPSKEELAFINAQALLEREILETSDERVRIDLEAQAAREQIAERVRKKELTREQELTELVRIRVEREQQLAALQDKLTRQREQDAKKLEEARQKELSAQAKQLSQEARIAALQGASAERVRQLELAAKLQEIIASGASQEEQARERQIALLEDTNARRKAELDIANRLRDAEIRRLELSGSVADQIRARELELDAEILDIQNSALSVEEERQRVANARLEAERDIQNALLEQARQQGALVSSTIAAATNTQGVQGALSDDFARREAEREAELARLRDQSARAEQDGASNEFLERRVALLEREGELERQNQELLQQRLSTITRLGAELGQLTEATIVLSAAAKGSQEAYEGQAAALSAATQLAGSLTGAYVKDLKRRATLNALFNAAAASAALAGYIASSGTAGNLLSASIKHGVAAVQFGVVAGTASAGSSGGSGGFASGAASAGQGGSQGAAVVDLQRERERSAEALAKAFAERANQPNQITYNLNVDGTMLANAPDTARELKRVLDSAEENVVVAQVSA